MSVRDILAINVHPHALINPGDFDPVFPRKCYASGRMAIWSIVLRIGSITRRKNNGAVVAYAPTGCQDSEGRGWSQLEAGDGAGMYSFMAE